MASLPEVIISEQRPFAPNSDRVAKFKESLQSDAHHSVFEPLSGKRLYSKVYYFYRQPTGIDVDNLCKPILDALKNIVYVDDSQVVLLVAAKVAVEIDTYQLILRHAALEEKYQRLLTSLASQAPHVLYIEVGELTDLYLDVGITALTP